MEGMITKKDKAIDEFMKNFAKLRGQLDSGVTLATREALFHTADLVQSIGMYQACLYHPQQS